MMISGTYPAPKMSSRRDPHVGMRTPWGKADHVRKMADGIWSVSTPGHGGFKLSAARNKEVPPAFRKAGGWYEEDLDAAIVVYFFADMMGPKADKSSAVATLKDFYPDEYTAHTGVVVVRSESRKLRERAAKEAAKGQWIGISARGDWAEGCPEGAVEVTATLGGIRDFSEVRTFYVSAEDYADRGEFGYVVPCVACPA